jgi:hypothetical protein
MDVVPQYGLFFTDVPVDGICRGCLIRDTVVFDRAGEEGRASS